MLCSNPFRRIFLYLKLHKTHNERVTLKIGIA